MLKRESEWEVPLFCGRWTESRTNKKKNKKKLFFWHSVFEPLTMDFLAQNCSNSTFLSTHMSSGFSSTLDPRFRCSPLTLDTRFSFQDFFPATVSLILARLSPIVKLMK